MGDSQSSVPRRTILLLSSATLPALSGCLGWLGLGGDDDPDGSSSGSDSNDDSTLPEQNGTDTNDSGSSTQNDTQNESSSRSDTETNESQNESAPDSDSENEAAVPESEPQNDPSDMEPASPDEASTGPTQDDLHLEESYYSKRNNRAVIVVTNTSQFRMKSVDFWVSFYDGTGNKVGENANGKSSVDPGQEITVKVPCQAGHATTFEIDRVIVQ